jgi:SAM-dependent methyltransferase
MTRLRRRIAERLNEAQNTAAMLTTFNEVDMSAVMALRERYRDNYWRKHDPIVEDRLLWRAQAFRHTVHLLPGQTILELGCGEFQLTRALLRVSRGENPITAVTFQERLGDLGPINPKVELLHLSQLPGPLRDRRFDCIVAMDLLDRDTSSQLLAIAHELLSPGGEIVFYESNPWNPVHKLRDLLLRLVGRRDPRNLISRPRLYELLSEIGFIRVYAVFNDFVFAPLTRPLIWFPAQCFHLARERSACSDDGGFDSGTRTKRSPSKRSG